MVRYCDKQEVFLKHTRTQPRSMSHSISSLPPPELNNRSSEHEGTSYGPRDSGCRIAKASESTFEGYGPASVYQIPEKISHTPTLSINGKPREGLTFLTTQACVASSSDVGPVVHSHNSILPFARPTVRVPNFKGCFPNVEAFLLDGEVEGRGKGGNARAVIAEGV